MRILLYFIRVLLTDIINTECMLYHVSRITVYYRMQMTCSNTEGNIASANISTYNLLFRILMISHELKMIKLGKQVDCTSSLIGSSEFILIQLISRYNR